MEQVSTLKTDVLVVGGGLAGLSAALAARERGFKVLVAAKGKVGRSGNSIITNNNIAAVLGDGQDGDTPVLHAEDTMKGGANINDPQLVRVLTENAGMAIEWLAECQVPFLQEKGKISIKGSPGHSKRRVVNVPFAHANTSGLSMTLPLLAKANSEGVELLENVLITGLIKDKGAVVGAYGLDKKVPKIWVVAAGAVILACGGVGSLYPVTTNTLDVTGDGYALAKSAGAQLRDMEFIQFHPAVTLGPQKLVMSTSPFADGAVLRNNRGEAYMKNYSPQADMATRDVMARANFAEISAGRGTERGGVYMDFSAVPTEIMTTKHREIYEYLKGKSMAEVAPAVHFMMGGISINEYCQSTLPGLYACGEASGGVHGANRLAGNALIEAVVFGLQAGKSVLINQETALRGGEFGQKLAAGLSLGEIGGAGQGDPELPQLRKELRQLVGRHAGLVRSREGLAEAVLGLKNINEKIKNSKVSNYTDLLAREQLRLMQITALAIVEAALMRKDSLGAHFRIN